MASGVAHMLGLNFPVFLAGVGTSSPGDSNPLVWCRFLPQDPKVGGIAGIQRQLPLGQVVDLRLGDVILPDGTTSDYPDSETFDATVEVGPDRSISQERASLIASGLYQAKRFAEGADDAGISRAFFHVVNVVSGKADVLLIPEFLLFTTYLAPNSRLAGSYYDLEIEHILACLDKDHRNRRHEDGLCRLHLGRGRLVSDVIPLARIRFDMTGVARATATRTARLIALTQRKGRPFTFACGFPFEGTTTLTYRATSFLQRSTGRTIHLVLDISGCTHPCPWTQLEAGIEQPSPKPSDSSSEPRTGGGGAKFEDFEDGFIPLDPEAERPESGDILGSMTFRVDAFDPMIMPPRARMASPAVRVGP